MEIGAATRKQFKRAKLRIIRECRRLPGLIRGVREGFQRKVLPKPILLPETETIVVRQRNIARSFTRSTMMVPDDDKLEVKIGDQHWGR